MKLRSFAKYMLVAVGIATVFILGALIYLVANVLPSPHEIVPAAFRKPSNTHTPNSQSKNSQPVAPVSPRGNETKNVVAEPAAKAEDKGPGEKVAKKNELENLKAMINEDPSDNRVCNNLGVSKYFHHKGAAARSKLLEEAFAQESRDDSVVESFRIPMRTILQDEKVVDLFKEIEEIEAQGFSENEKKSFMDKIGFYSKLAYTAAHLYSRKDEFEDVGNRAIHLGVIAKIAALKPKFAEDPQIKSFCNDIQNSITERRPADIREERLEIMKALEHAGLKPADVDFDPQQFIKLRINHTKDKFEISLADREPNKSVK
jgi:hypothetical protein